MLIMFVKHSFARAKTLDQSIILLGCHLSRTLILTASAQSLTINSFSCCQHPYRIPPCIKLISMICCQVAQRIHCKTQYPTRYTDQPLVRNIKIEH